MSAMVISSLPESLLIPSVMSNESIGEILSVFSEYLSIEDISRLDVAICNKIKRQVFLTLVQSEKFILKGEKQQKRGFITWLSARFINVRQLECDRLISEHEFIKIANCGRFIEKIKLSNRNINDMSIIKIAEYCPNLRMLDLTRIDRVTDRSILKIAERCLKLEVLILVGCYLITDVSIIRIMENCPNLMDIQLAGCRNVTVKIEKRSS
mmetsp:Transcript_34975/g.33252  ORF Transcript_34975/g.33252 Transcript_34975/m.33252 type:complete len:210 (-) Transcript_34975:13-642(-)